MIFLLVKSFKRVYLEVEKDHAIVALKRDYIMWSFTLMIENLA